MGMHILLLGGSGNLSQTCATLLAERGHRVSVLTRGLRPAPEGCRALVADRHDLEGMRRAIGGDWPDAVINFIGFNVAELQLDHALFAGHVSQYLFISSTTVYAKPHRQLPLTEDAPRGNPFSDYAQQKHLCEDFLLERFRADGFPVTLVRPSHTYSRRWIPNPVKSDSYTLAARMEAGKPVFIHGDGQNLWTLTAAEDFAVGVAGLVGRAEAAGEAFHITGDEVLTWNQIYAEIARALGVARPRILKIPTWFICREAPRMVGSLPGDKAEHAVFDNAKIKAWVPDFHCRTRFREGIAAAVRWFREDPARQAVNPDTDAVFERVCNAWLAGGGSGGS